MLAHEGVNNGHEGARGDTRGARGARGGTRGHEGGTRGHEGACTQHARRARGVNGRASRCRGGVTGGGIRLTIQPIDPMCELRAVHVIGWPSCVCRPCSQLFKSHRGPNRHFRAAIAIPLGRIATLRGTCRPVLHGPRCARPVSILGLSDAAEHAGGARHVSFPDPSRNPFRAPHGAAHAAGSGALRPDVGHEAHARSLPA